MVHLKSAALALLYLGAAVPSMAAEQEPIAPSDEIPDPRAGDSSPAADIPISKASLDIELDTQFPEMPLGIKLVNGHTTTAHITIKNKEPSALTVRAVGSSLWPLEGEFPDVVAVRNLTTNTYEDVIPPGEDKTVLYQFKTEMHPQDLKLAIAMVLQDQIQIYQIPVWNGTISIVEAPISVFDPQMLFLYVFLLGLFAGTVYLIYRTWVAPLLQDKQKQRRVPGPSRTKSQQDTAATAATSGSKVYDESWIPTQHLNRPEAKRVRSGAPKTRAK